MTALYATLRLIWRPLTLMLLAAWSLVVGLVLQVASGVSEVAPVLRALWLGTAPPEMATALWMATAVAPAGLGLAVAMNRLDLQHTTLSWHLPDLRRRLLVGSAVGALVLGIAAAALAARNGLAAAPVFALAAYGFLMPGFCFDVAVSRPARGLMSLPLIAVVGWPQASLEHALQYPWPLTTFGLALAAWPLRTLASEPLARRRPFRWSALRRSGSKALYWSQRRARRPDWHVSLATERLMPWLRAAMYESERRYPIRHVQIATVAVLAARLMDMPQGIAIWAGSFLMTADAQLHMRAGYPLPRVRRAKLAYAGTVVDALTLALFLGVLLYATFLVSFPRLPGIDRTPAPTLEWLLALGCSLALAPIVQWSRILRPDEDTSRLRGTRMAVYLVRLIVYLFAVAIAARAIGGPERAPHDLGTILIAIGVLAVVVQACHAAMVYVHYTKGDLVRAAEMR